MSGPLLETKLFVPKRRPQLVMRSRLLRRLDEALTSKLTLISAPPGFGKTTLLADWYETAHPHAACIAWLTLDLQDNQPPTYWRYVVAALERTTGGIGREAGALLESEPSTPVRTVLATLINELNTAEGEIILLLDDYHFIESREVQEEMAFLLDHLPQRLHVVLASRADPPLPLARMRARGELAEIRAADLRFQPDEAASYLNDVMDLSLSDADLDALEGRTEGWIAALQLAALSLQGRDDVSGFIEHFAGDNRYIVDYLVEEVLQQQPGHVSTFLLQTSILDRLSTELCDAVTSQKDSQAMLRYLEDANVFLVPLDDRRRWYRYHHLFAEVLRARLSSEHPQLTKELHVRASRWFQCNDEVPSAVRHALAASDFGRAAGLIELSALSLLRSRQETTVLSWLDALPDEVIRSRPVLSVGYAGALMNSGEFTGVERRLRDAEQMMETASLADLEAQIEPATAAFVDEAQFRELPGMIALYRAAHAQVLGNLEDTETHARKALEVMPEGAPLRGGAMALLGLALWSNGELEAAYKIYFEGIALTHRGGYVNDSSVLMLADIRVSQGRLREAFSAYGQALQLADEQGTAAPRGVADLHTGISEIHREQGELALAEEHLTKSRELGEVAGLPEIRYRWFTAMAGVKQSQEDFDGALELLQQAESLYGGGFSPDLRPIASMRARIWIKQGRLNEASFWAQEKGLSPGDELTYLREFDHVTLARLQLVRGDPQTGMELLKRLLSAAEAGGRVGTAIEVLVLLALSHSTQRDRTLALATLKRALSLAEPEGYVRVFLDEGPALQRLLTEASKQADAGYARRLLAWLEQPQVSTANSQHEDYDQLSERELEVVRLLGSDLSGPDIARELVVSLNTIRTHTKSIYAKLGVNSRRAAVRRAQELHLL